MRNLDRRDVERETTRRFARVGTETRPTTADHALLLAARAWGGPNDPPLWDRFSADWRDRLGSIEPTVGKLSARSARESLRLEHQASGRSDPSRIHPSWYVRALQAESPAVRRAVLENAPEPIRSAIRKGLKWVSPEPDFPPDPEALSWALAFWTERLIGDVADRDDDPPIVVAVTRLTSRDLLRMVKACGQVKFAFATDRTQTLEPGQFPMNATARVRLGFFRRQIGAADRRLIPAAQTDLKSVGDELRRLDLRVGLLTVGRLLGAVEPHRARWASQHLPYPIARMLRETSKPPLPPRPLVAWESWNLEAAWARLLSEGRLVGRRGGDS